MACMGRIFEAGKFKIPGGNTFKTVSSGCRSYLNQPCSTEENNGQNLQIHTLNNIRTLDDSD